MSKRENDFEKSSNSEKFSEQSVSKVVLIQDGEQLVGAGAITSTSLWFQRDHYWKNVLKKTSTGNQVLLLREMMLIICDDKEPLETPIAMFKCEIFNRELWSMNTEMRK